MVAQAQHLAGAVAAGDGQDRAPARPEATAGRQRTRPFAAPTLGRLRAPGQDQEIATRSEAVRHCPTWPQKTLLPIMLTR